MWKPSDIFWEVSEEAAARMLATKHASMEDTAPTRRYPPSCKMNGVQLKDAHGKVFASADLYYDDHTQQWLLALQPEAYPELKKRRHSPHDTLGALVL